MEQTPKSLRLQIAIFGRTNVGKSSFLNFLANQDIAVISPVPGTTTDVVEKTMELLPLGPVTLLDTAGLDDKSELASLRIQKANKIFERADLIVLLTEPNIWTEFEEDVIIRAKKKNIPTIIGINKIDIQAPKPEFIEQISNKGLKIIPFSCFKKEERDNYVNKFKEAFIELIANKKQLELTLLDDIIKPNSLIICIVPIDSEAPKGRLILPQVQTIRNVLDNNSIAIVTKETEYVETLRALARKPDLVICDSQVVKFMVENTPPEIKCTTFSILFGRFKGDFDFLVQSVKKIDELQPNDKILIAEACTHHPNEDDIARVKIPRWLKEYLGWQPQIDYITGRDFPQDLSSYKLIIHCGACMLTRTEKLARQTKAQEQSVPITNYGIAISYLNKVFDRVMEPFQKKN